MSDKRGNLRHLVNAPVKLSHSSFGEIKALTADISNTGAFVTIRNKPRLPKGAHIKLQFLQSAYPDITFNTRVVRSTEDGFGLAFVDYELDGNRYAITDLKNVWKRK